MDETHVGGSTDNLNEWVLSFHQVDLGVKLGLADLVASSFTCQDISTALP